MADDPQKSTSSSAVWDRLNQQSDFIGELARNQAATEANLAALATSVESGFNQINASLNRVIERDSRPTNWIGLAGLFFVLVGAFVTFVALQTAPLSRRTIENSAAIEALQTHRQRTSAMEAQVQLLLDEQKRIEDFRNEANYRHGYIDGRLVALQLQLDAVDMHGSRRWTRRDPE